VSGNNVRITQYKDVGVSKCGTPISGLLSASYSFSRNVNSIFSSGRRTPIVSYGNLPEITVSYSAYEGSFDPGEANSFSTIDISGAGGSVSVSYALLTSFSFEMTVEGYLSVTKTFTGYAKTSGGGGGGGALTEPTISKRQDFSGSLPPGLSGNYLQKVSGSIEIGRQTIAQFATRKPYASVVSFPIISSITYDFFTNSMDSLSVDDLEAACKNPGSQTYSASVSACGFSFDISKAFVTSIDYSGAEASNTTGFQNGSVTYSSYQDIPQIKPVIIFNNESSEC
jgi:hypothetical protein